jgi:energy-converting hydrogenase Eha subunit A
VHLVAVAMVAQLATGVGMVLAALLGVGIYRNRRDRRISIRASVLGKVAVVSCGRHAISQLVGGWRERCIEGLPHLGQ